AFDVPAGVLGATAIAQTANPYENVGFSSLTAPDGVVLVSNYGIPNTLADFESYGATTLGIPQTDMPQEMPIASGTWQLTVDGGDATTSAHVSVWMRETLDGAFHGGVIDVNVFAAPNLQTDDYYKYALKQAFSDYAGLQLGSVNIFPLDAQYSTI